MPLDDLRRKFLTLKHVDPDTNIPTLLQDPDIAGFASQIKEEYRRRVDERRPFEAQWRLNQNFVAGNQYCDVFLDTGLVEDLPLLRDDETRAVYNQIAPINEIRLSKLSRVHPGLTVRPMTSDTRDITTAKTSTRILKAAYVEQEMDEKRDDLNVWSEQTGGVLMKSVWDPREGRCIGNLDGKPIHEGDLSSVVVPYYEFFPSSCYETDLQKMDSIIHAKVYSVDEIWNRWGIEMHGQDISVYAVNTTGVVAGGSGFLGSMPSIVQDVRHQSELVLEYYERPSVMFPEGRHAIIVGDYCVHLGPLRFRVGKHNRLGYPFAHQRCLKKPGVFWGTTVVERCIPLQRNYNATWNMINEYLSRMGIGNLAVMQGSLVDDSVLEGGLVPGQVVEYNQGFQPPVWLVPEEVPQSLPQQIEALRQEFIIISGVSEMARSSQAPASISSGNALEVLKEQDDTRLSITAENIRNFYKEVGCQWLRLFKQFATQARVSRVVGDDFGDVYGFMWDQNDITSDDVVVDTENEMINTPAQRKQNALDLLNAGLFNDPDTGRLTREGRAKVMEIYGLGNMESAIDVDELQMANARRENMMALYKGDLEIAPFDNHSLHQAEHMRFVLGAEFRELFLRDREHAQLFLDHLAAHKEAAVQEALALSGQGAPMMVANGQPMDKAVSVAAQDTGNMGAGQ